MNDNSLAESGTFKEWKQKRRNTVVGYLIVGVIGGMDYSIVFATLYLYLKDLVKTNQPQLYYGLVIGAFSLSSTILGTFAGRWIDKKRRMRLYTNIVLLMQLTGNIMYVIHFSPIYLIVGRLVAGAGDTFSSVATGEIVRIFDTESGTRALWWLASAYSIGFVFGPLFGLLFKDVVYFKIGSVTINYLNFPGVFMASLMFIALIIVNFLLHDCSAEFDLKEYYREEKQKIISNSKGKIKKYSVLATTNEPETVNENVNANQGDICVNSVEYNPLQQLTEQVQSDTDVNQKHQETMNRAEYFIENEPLLKTNSKEQVVPIARFLKQVGRNFDVVIIFLSSFICMYCMFSLDVLIPLITNELLKWDLMALTIIFCSHGVAYFIALIIFSIYVKTNKAVYNMCVICIFLQIIGLGLIVAMKRANRNFARDIVLMVTFQICFLFGWFVEEVLLRSIIARMVPSNVQSFTESMRSTFSRAATVISALTAPLAFPYLDWFSIGIAFFLFMFFLCFLQRYKTLRNIKEISFTDLSCDIDEYDPKYELLAISETSSITQSRH